MSFTNHSSPRSLDDRVRPRHGDVVEEDVAAGIATRPVVVVLIDQERRPGVRAALHQQQRLTGLEFIVREGELVVPLIFDLDGRKGDRGVFLQWMPTVAQKRASSRFGCPQRVQNNVNGPLAQCSGAGRRLSGNPRS